MKNVFCFLAIIPLAFFTSCGKPTNACFSYSPGTVTAGAAVTFNASCSENASYYTWDFGDDSADTTVTSATVIHVYTTPGQFTVTLRAEKKDGKSSKKSHFTATQTVTVQ